MLRTLILLCFLFALSARAQLPTSNEGPNEPEVFQREYILTNAQALRAVQTYGVYTCVALAVYDRGTQKGVLAHLDAQVDLSTALNFLTRDFNLAKADIYVLGGQPSDGFRLREKLIDRITELGGRVRHTVSNLPGREMSLRLDLATGEVSTYSERYSSTSPEVAAAKMERLKFGTRLYRHQDSLGGGDSVELPNEPAPWN